MTSLPAPRRRFGGAAAGDPPADRSEPAATDWLARWRRAAVEHPLRTDGLFALGLVAVQAMLWVLAPPKFQPAGIGSMIATVAVTLPVAVRRRWTWGAILITAAIFSICGFFGPRLDSQSVPLIALGYTAAAWLPLWSAAAATVLLWGTAFTELTNMTAEDRAAISGKAGLTYVIVANLLVGAVVFFIGRTARHRRRSTRALEDRAKAAEANQRALADRAVADERRRIARELHDVVAHHVSVMGVLASGARRTLRRDPDQTNEALVTIEETGRGALRELRRLVAVLRTQEDAVVELTPQPDLAAITSLIEQVRDAGLPVTLTVTGDQPLPPGLALTAYRIVQEALTNSLKHAGQALAQVRLDIAATGLSIEVYDTGRGPALATAPMNGAVGHGLLGMRERVTLYGGTLRTGPRPGGGFRVFARIPLDAPDAGPPDDSISTRVSG
jgi:signal transduction histidine kinase